MNSGLGLYISFDITSSHSCYHVLPHCFFPVFDFFKHLLAFCTICDGPLLKIQEQLHWKAIFQEASERMVNMVSYGVHSTYTVLEDYESFRRLDYSVLPFHPSFFPCILIICAWS